MLKANKRAWLSEQSHVWHQQSKSGSLRHREPHVFLISPRLLFTQENTAGWLERWTPIADPEREKSKPAFLHSRRDWVCARLEYVWAFLNTLSRHSFCLSKNCTEAVICMQHSWLQTTSGFAIVWPGCLSQLLTGQFSKRGQLQSFQQWLCSN